MYMFRIICAVLLATATNWAFGQPEATAMLEELPKLEFLGIVAAVWVGAFSLAVRQGWGMIVAIANGVWAGVLTIILAGAAFMMVLAFENVGVVTSFRRWMEVFESDAEPALDLMMNLPLMLKTVAAAALVGVITEAIHWALVRLRRARGDAEEEHGVTTLRQNPRDLW